MYSISIYQGPHNSAIDRPSQFRLSPHPFISMEGGQRLRGFYPSPAVVGTTISFAIIVSLKLGAIAS